MATVAEHYGMPTLVPHAQAAVIEGWLATATDVEIRSELAKQDEAARDFPIYGKMSRLLHEELVMRHTLRSLGKAYGIVA